MTWQFQCNGKVIFKKQLNHKFSLRLWPRAQNYRKKANYYWFSDYYWLGQGLIHVIKCILNLFLNDSKWAWSNLNHQRWIIPLKTYEQGMDLGIKTNITMFNLCGSAAEIQFDVWSTLVPLFRLSDVERLWWTQDTTLMMCCTET